MITGNGRKLKQNRFRLGVGKKSFPCKGNQGAAEFTQRGFAVSALGCFKDQTGQSPEQPNLTSQLTLLEQDAGSEHS